MWSIILSFFLLKRCHSDIILDWIKKNRSENRGLISFIVFKLLIIVVGVVLRNLLAATPRGFVDNMLNQNECWRAYRLIVLLSVKQFGKQLFLIILYFNLFAFVRLSASSWFVECHLFIFPPHMTVSFVHIIFFQS